MGDDGAKQSIKEIELKKSIIKGARGVEMRRWVVRGWRWVGTRKRKKLMMATEIAVHEVVKVGGGWVGGHPMGGYITRGNWQLQSTVSSFFSFSAS